MWASTSGSRNGGMETRRLPASDLGGPVMREPSISSTTEASMRSVAPVRSIWRSRSAASSPHRRLKLALPQVRSECLIRVVRGGIGPPIFRFRHPRRVAHSTDHKVGVRVLRARPFPQITMTVDIRHGCYLNNFNTGTTVSSSVPPHGRDLRRPT